jgi:hypothetical protein
MDLSKASLKKVGSVCLFVDGFILLFYGLFVPVFVHGIHWLITLLAILFLIALPAIYRSLAQVQKVVAKVVVVLLGVAMMVLVLSDLLFVQSFLSGLGHDLAYALGNVLLLICLFAIGVIALKGVFFKWFGYMSILTAIIGLATYLPQVPSFLYTVSLLLLGLWCLAFGFNILKVAK